MSAPAVAERPDLRLAAPALGSWLVALVTLGTSVRVAAVVAACCAAMCGAALVAGRRLPSRARHTVPATFACAAAVAACVASHLMTLASGPLPALAARAGDARVELVVSGDPAVGDESGPVWDRGRTVTVPATLRVLTVPRGTYRGRQPVVLFSRARGWSSLTPGQRVSASVSAARPRDRGEIAATLFARAPPRLLGRPPFVQRVAAGLRAGLRDSVARLPADERGLVPGLVVGDTSRLSDELKEEFKQTGLTHLLAVSGANIAIASGAILAVGRRARLPPRALATVGAVGIVGFVVLARPEPSVLRAAVMGGIAMLALGTGRRHRGLPALFAAVLLLVCLSPSLARSYGFALSVLATLGLLVLAPPWRDRLVARGCPRRLAEALAVPAAAQVMCGPVIVLLAAQVNVLGVLANLLAAPAVPPVTILGVLATAVHPLFPPAARLLGWCAWLPTWWLVHVARYVAALPGASVGWPGGVAGAVALAGLTVVAFLALPHRRVRRVVAVAVTGFVVASGALRVVSPTWPPSGWRLLACDVGQGDAMLLEVAAHTAVVVDTGPDAALMEACLDRVGVRRVPLLLITHMHADHASGVPAVFVGRKVDAVATGALEVPADQWRRVTATAAAAGIRVTQPTAGAVWRIGALTLRVLWPPAGYTDPTVFADDASPDGSAPNNASLVVRASWPGLSMLLTGDVEPPVQERILDSGADLRADVLKVPHHGSARQEPRFLAATGARVAVICVGADNDYGHPAPPTLRALAADGMRVLRTDQDGDVAILETAQGRLAFATRANADVSSRAPP
ncbi:MAG: ComEC/Rec2 family competence protein [Streptosporangiales bacterium]|nr:ComEC/Rec2 family competence protein [Streptosporangiales bacterium]